MSAVRGAAQYRDLTLKAPGTPERHDDMYLFYDASRNPTNEDTKTNTIGFIVPEIKPPQHFSYYVAIQQWAFVTVNSDGFYFHKGFPVGTTIDFPGYIVCDQISADAGHGDKIMQMVNMPFVITSVDTHYAMTNNWNYFHGKVGQNDLNWYRLQMSDACGLTHLSFRVKTHVEVDPDGGSSQNLIDDAFHLDQLHLHLRIARRLNTDARIGRVSNELDPYLVSQSDPDEPHRRLRSGM